MHYYLYEIRNNLNGKIYVGVHRAKSLDDGYMGSGKVIKRAIQKHGLENFTKVILETFDDSTTMYAREKEVVTDEFLSRDDVYNLRRGGDGGFDYLNKTPGLKHIQPFTDADRLKGQQSLALVTKEQWSLICKRQYVGTSREYRSSRTAPARSKSNSEQAALKKKSTFTRINHQQGEKNSQFGKMWITDGVVSKTVLRSELVGDGWRPGRIIKKL